MIIDHLRESEVIYTPRDVLRRATRKSALQRGTNWTRVGGYGVNSGWANSASKRSFHDRRWNNLYAGVGNTRMTRKYGLERLLFDEVGGDGANAAGPQASNKASMTYFGGIYSRNHLTAATGMSGVTMVALGRISAATERWAASTYEGVYSLKNDGITYTPVSA